MSLILDNYKGKKSGKEYDDAFNKLKAHLAIKEEGVENHNTILKDDNKSTNSNVLKQDKKGFLGSIFGKK